MPHITEICHTRLSMESGNYDWKALESTIDDNQNPHRYPISRTPTPEHFDQLDFSSLLDSTSRPGGINDAETRVLTDMSGNLMQSVDTTREVGVSKSISQNLIGKDSENEGARTGNRKPSAPPNPIPKSIEVISEAKYLSLGRSAKRKYEMAYGNAEGTFYGLKSSRLETPQEFIAKTRKCYKELMKSEERFSLCAGAPGRRGNSYEPDSAEVDVEGSIHLPFEELVNLDIWDGEN